MRPGTADIVVVGAGAAGCVIAAALSADPRRRVVLVEAGGGDANPLFRIPLMAGVLFRVPYANWQFETEPEPALDDRRIAWPRGRVVGGSTTINGMIWHRGRPSDYEAWAREGLHGWGWSSVLPVFRGLERHAWGESEHHGGAGPVPVEPGASDNPLHQVFLDAAAEAGHAVTADCNAPPHEGAYRHHFTIAAGERWSASRCFLWPALGRANLRLLARTHVRRIVIEGGRATGVEVRSREGSWTIHAGTVVLAAGAVGSPQLLMLSGVGPADGLRGLGIPVRHDAPGVGQNLQDHLSLRVQHACREPVTLHALMRPDRALAALLQAGLFRRGPATHMPIGTGVQFRSEASLAEPDVQGFFTPAHSQSTVRLPFTGRWMPPSSGHAYALSFYGMRPSSRGEIHLRTADPRDPPLIRPRYLSDPADRARMHAALSLVRDILSQPAFAPYRGDETSPGSDVRSPAAVDAWMAATGGSAFHPVGTCRMGAEGDPGAVVEPDLRVRGVAGLRIADASVFPRQVSGNTMAPTLMVAARCSAMIERDA